MSYAQRTFDSIDKIRDGSRAHFIYFTYGYFCSTPPYDNLYFVMLETA